MKPEAGERPRADRRVLGIPIALAAWLEVFFFLPVHVFWISYKCAPFGADNRVAALAVATPFAVMAVVGLAMLYPRVRTAVARVEWMLHLTGAAGWTVLLAYLVLRDPFNPGLPLSWPLCMWSVSASFILLANLALHARTSGNATALYPASGWVAAMAVAIMSWAALLWLGSGMAWPPYYWSLSIVFHALAAPLSRRQALTPPEFRVRPFTRVVAFSEALFIAAVLTAVMLRLVFSGQISGMAEWKYAHFVGFLGSGWFVGGAAAALVLHRVRGKLLGHSAALALLFLTEVSARWPVSLALGYAIPALFLATVRVGPLGYALAALTAACAWFLGLLGFTLSGVITVANMGAAPVDTLAGRAVLAAALLLALWAVLAAEDYRRRRHLNAVQQEIPSTPVPTPAALTYAAVWALAAAPMIALLLTAMWPPVWFQRAPRVVVGEPTGICHAGYSSSDEEYAILRKLGVRLIRIPFYWTQIQPDKETWDFSTCDQFMAAADKHGMKVLAVLAFDNNAVEKSADGAARNVYLAPEDLPLFAEFIARTVERYKDRVYAWEIWNEPDIPQFWGGTTEEFYPVARTAADAVRAAAPDARLLGTAMTSMLGLYSAPGIEGLHASGALRQVDHPAMHTYVSDPRAYYNEFRRVQNAAAKHGHPGPVWITELGGPTGGVYPWLIPASLRPGHLLKAYTIATSLGIEHLFWHCYQDADPETLRRDPLNSEWYFGLVRHGGEWKPAAYAYRLFSTHCSNSVIRSDAVHVRGGIAARQLRSALYRRDNGESALVLWYESGLRPGARALVSLDLGALEEPAVVHDIRSDDTSLLVKDGLDIGEEPRLITFTAPDADTPVRIVVTGSPADGAWLLLLAAALGVSAATSRRM